jgi:phage shock protein A
VKGAAFFRRGRRIISSNLNALRERAENPQRLLDELIREMETAVRQTQDKTAQAIAGLQKLQRKLEEQRQLAEQWEQRAAQALRGGDEATARQCLARKRVHAQAIAQLEAQVQRQQEAVEDLKQSLQVLRAKLEEAQARALALQARAAGAEAQKLVAEATGGTPDTSAFDEFERLAERIEQRADVLEAAAELDVDQLEARFAQEEAEAELEADLEALRQRLQAEQ